MLCISSQPTSHLFNSQKPPQPHQSRISRLRTHVSLNGDLAGCSQFGQIFDFKAPLRDLFFLDDADGELSR